DVPINLPPHHKDEALRIRNKLLLFRFRNLQKRHAIEDLVDRTIEPRLNQIFVPLISIVDDPKAQAELRDLARRYNGEMIDERGMDMEAQVLEAIRDMLTLEHADRLGVKDITERFIDRHGADYDRKITTKWIGTVIRRRLNLRTQKSHGVFVIPAVETSKLLRLYAKYGVEVEPVPTSGEIGSEHSEAGA
ncbi:MAG: hypothetical protein ACREMY_29230, partial [bacterium]